MKTYQLSDNEYNILKSIISNEIEDLASTEIEFYEDLISQKISIKEYLDEHIILAEKFDIDFWNTVKLYTNRYCYTKLMTLYEGKSIVEFNETYEFSETSEIKLLVGALSKSKKRSTPLNNHSLELEELKNRIEEIERELEEDEDFGLLDVFEELNDIVLAQHKKIYKDLTYCFSNKIFNEKTEEIIRKELKGLEKLRNRIISIQSQAGEETHEDILKYMFPNLEDDES